MSPSRKSVGVVLIVLLCVLAWWRWRASHDSARAPTAHGDRDDRSRSSGGPARWARVAGGSDDPARDPEELVLTLRGRVVEPTLQPVRDAAVEILFRPAGGAAAAMPEIRSDGDGRFEITRLRAGLYRLEAHKGDSVSPTVEVELTAATAPVTLMVLPGATLAVTVVSAADERPIAGATVRVAPGNPELGPVEAARVAVTDEHGVARFVGLNAVGNHGIQAEAAGFGGATTNVLAGAHSRRQDWHALVRLKAGARISGRVTDGRGQPVEGVRVGWLAAGPGGAGDSAETSSLFSPFQGITRLGTPLTGADGRYVLSVEAGRGSLEALHPSYQPGRARELTVVAGHDLTVDLVVGDGARLAGVVVNAQGQPVPGAEVLITTPGWPHQQMFMDAYRFRATTDRAGEFAFRGVDRAQLAIVAFARDATSEVQEVDLKSAAERTGIVLQLQHEGRIGGLVVDAAKAPVPYAQVTYFVEAQSVTAPPDVSQAAQLGRVMANPRSQGAVLADGNGRFVIAGLVDGDYQVTAQRPTATSVAPAYGTAQARARPGQDVTLQLPGLGSVSGRVVWDDGTPAIGVGVTLARWQGASTAYPPSRTVERADGRFSFEEVPAARYGVKVTGENVVELTLPEAIEVTASKGADVGTLKVSRGRTRHGTVFNGDGAPVAQAHVVMQLGDRPTWDEVADEKGGFTVPPVAAGQSARLRAWTKDASSEWTEPPATGEVKLVLAGGSKGTIDGLLLDSGRPIEKRLLVVTLPGVVDPNLTRTRGQASSEAGGRFRFEKLDSGPYKLWLRRATEEGPEWIPYASVVTVEPSKEVSVVFNVLDAQR